DLEGRFDLPLVGPKRLHENVMNRSRFLDPSEPDGYIHPATLLRRTSSAAGTSVHSLWRAMSARPRRRRPSPNGKYQTVGRHVLWFTVSVSVTKRRVLYGNQVRTRESIPRRCDFAPPAAGLQSDFAHVRRARARAGTPAGCTGDALRRSAASLARSRRRDGMAHGVRARPMARRSRPADAGRARRAGAVVRAGRRHAAHGAAPRPAPHRVA